MQLSVASLAPVAAAPGAIDRGGAPASLVASAGGLAAPAARVTLSAAAGAGGELRPLGAGDPAAAPDVLGDGTGGAGADGLHGEAPPARALGAARGAAAGRRLTAEQLRLVAELAARDRQVRAHEAAHMAAGGALTGGARFSYQTGPDGKLYAVGGEVSVQLRAGGTPDEVIARARQVRAAALAPADPSAQDLAVAAAAMSLELEALAARARQAAAAYRSAAGAPGEGAPAPAAGQAAVASAA